MDKKLISAIIGTTLIAGAGTYTIQEAQINKIETELASTTATLTDSKKAERYTLKHDIYNTIRIGQTPSYDVSIATTDEISQAVADIINENGLTKWSGTANEAIKSIAQNKGELLTCSK